MRHSCLWNTVAVLAILIPGFCTDSSISKQYYKVNEVGNSPVVGKVCGTDITDLWEDLCGASKRKRRSMFLDEKEALNFLQQQTQRHRRSAGQTDIVEECCHEGCATEEVLEYC